MPLSEEEIKRRFAHFTQQPGISDTSVEILSQVNNNAFTAAKLILRRVTNNSLFDYSIGDAINGGSWRFQYSDIKDGIAWLDIGLPVGAEAFLKGEERDKATAPYQLNAADLAHKNTLKEFVERVLSENYGWTPLVQIAFLAAANHLSELASEHMKQEGHDAEKLLSSQERAAMMSSLCAHITERKPFTSISAPEQVKRLEDTRSKGSSREE